MARLLLLLTLVLMVMALLGVVVSMLMRLAREGQSLVEDMGDETRRTGLQKVGYVALILVMLGVTSGLIGGL